MKSIKLDGIDIKDIISIAKKAGQRILGFYDNDIEVVTKQDSSPLTKADLAAHNLIIDSLKNLFPDMPILSEESKEIAWDERKKWSGIISV